MVGSNFYIGADLGKLRGYTAIVVVERAVEKGALDPVMYAYKEKVSLRLRHLQRVPLGTAYPDVAWQVMRVAQAPDLLGRCELAVGATGVGRAVLDLIEATRPGCPILPVLVTGGEKETHHDDCYGVPKRDLITGLQVMLQMGELEIADGLSNYQDLLGEMSAMEVRMTESGREQYGAWREGTHDDLVFAVA